MATPPTRRPTRPDRQLPPTPTVDHDHGLSKALGEQLAVAEHGAPSASAAPKHLPDLPPALEQPKPAVSLTALFSDAPGLSASPTEEPRPSPPVDERDTLLTPLRAHYLKKTLIDLQFSRELVLLTTAPADPAHSTLSYLGPPFTPPLTAQQQAETPFLRYMFRQFALTFPFLSAAPRDFFAGKLQPFVASVLARNITSQSTLLDSEDDVAEQRTRRKMFQKMEKNFGLVLGAATKLTEKEEVVRLSQKDLDRLEQLAAKRRRRMKEADVFDVNVVSVRTVVAKGRVRSRAHEEFVIRTRRSNFPDIYVSRRYGDFRTLSDELRKQHPMESPRPPPPKDRTAATLTFSQSASATLRGMYSSAAANQDSDESLPSTPPPGPGSAGAAASGTGTGTGYTSQATSLSREKNRLTLRAYLHALLSVPTLAGSPVLRSFLTANPIKLGPDEEADMRRREEADGVREEGRKQFAKEVAERVEALRDAVREVKGNLMAKDGLTRVFATVKVTSDVRELPPDYKAVLAWGRISLAATIFQTFVASDTGSETLASMKRVHGMMPYFVLKGILRISNPIAMIRGILDLFLAAPFGGPSLLQRMFSTSLTEEVKGLQEDIEAVKEKIGDDVLCEKVKIFVDAPQEIQQVYKADAAEENISLLAVVLRSVEGPPLDQKQFQRVVRASRAHASYLHQRASLDDSDDDSGPQDEEGWLFEDLGILLKLYARLKDREQMLALIFEGSTAELLKDIITIFYSPLAQVYKAASIADSISDMQTFINDMIKTVEAVEELSQEDPHRTVQTFIDLVQRHEQSFYNFVHRVHAKGEGLFDSLIRWIELFLDLMREGLGAPVSLEYILPHSGTERADILREVDQVAHYHYRLKIAYEEKLRRRFGNNTDGTEGEDEIARDLIDGVVRDLSFGELVQSDATGISAEESEDESDEYESDGSDGSDEVSGSDASSRRASLDEARELPAGSRSQTVTSHESQKSTATVTRHATTDARQKPLPQPVPQSVSGMGQLPKPRLPKVAGSDIRPPELTHIPGLLPVFVEIVRPSLIPRSV